MTLAGVVHGHAGTEPPVLQGIDLVLPPGQLAVLTGASGTGKTTLADILIGLVAPDRGRLLVDAAPIDTPGARDAWRGRIGYVPQDPFLFDRSIRDNLTWAAPLADDAQLWSALDAAEAGAFVRARPGGLDSRAGERGALLSGGERQRICLARALLGHPALLVLDEATSALDPVVEQRLLDTLQALRGTTTILLIAHRLPDGFRADRRFHLEKGRVWPIA